MSRSNSTGDLVPRDITEVLAQQNRANKGKKKQGSSLGRAFSWLKGTKRKRSISNGLGGGAGGLGGGAAGLGGGAGDDRTSKPGHVNQEPSRAGTKQDEQKKLSVHYTASQIYPENVFIEGSRPQYLEDLHTEAQEGLKILQQEEHKNNVDFRDDHTVSTDATQTERDDLSRETDGSVASSSTAGSSVASVPTVCSRPVLTRQGSTFKPLNPVKRLDKTRRRSRRTTIMGIPQQVQMELGMGRGALAQQLPNGEGSVSNGIVIIPTVDGEKPVMNHEGARVHLQDIEAFQASREEHLLRQHIHRVYRDDLALNRKVGPRPSPNQRPKSLAVPGMTSSSLLQEPQGPVMSISPQATYLSKIIPNAILPAAVDVIKIDRSRSRSSVRSSVRTVSKSSLPPASPASSRSEGSSMDEPASSGSNWSQSQSSETIVSNSSTISSKRSGQTSSAGVRHLKTGDQVSIQSSSSWLSSDKADDKGMQSRCVSAGEGSDSGNCVRNSYIFSRSLSITKTKLPPAPPRRTYSLHHEKLKRRSRELMDIKDSCDLGPNRTQIGTDPGNSMPEAISSNRVNTPTKSTVSSSQNNSQSSVTSGTSSPEQDSSGDQSVSSNSSPQKVTLDKSAFDRTLSPSSGYSSQSGTPTLSHKVIYPPSPGKQRAKPPKPERTGSRTSSAISVSSSTSSISSPQSEPVHRDTQPKDTPSHPTKTPPSVKTENNKESSPPSTIILKELSNIPPPPKVKAPSPPPPETWAHNKRTFELLCGPGPNITRMNQLLKAQQKEVLLINTESDSSAKQTVHCLSESEAVASERNEPLSIQAHEHTTELERETLALGHKESSVSHKKDTESLLIKKEEALMSQGQAERLTNLGMDQDTHAMAEKSHINMPQNTQTEADDTSLVVLKSSHMETENGNKEDAIEHVGKSLENDQQLCSHLYVKACKDSSPPPSPPPAHHPPPPPKKSPTTSVSTTACEEEETFIMESSWPPPPPPMEDSSDLVFEGQEEVDFPPPPPLLMQDSPFKPGETCVKCEGHADVTLRRSSESPEVSHGMTDGVESKGHLTTVPDEEDLTDQLSNIPEVLQTEPHPLADENLSNNVANRAQTTGPAPAHSRPSPESQAVQHVPAKPSTPPQIAPKPPTILTTNEYNHQMPRGMLAQVPLAPPPPVEDQSTINFKRTPSLSSKESKSKDLLSRNKCIPIPKEDANIPLVTPSLLQMVRLRSVSVGEDPGKVPQAGKSCPEGPTSQEQTLSHATPQKPVRKSLCLKSTPPQTLTSPPATTPAPSMCLQEAIRMKTAAMSSRDRHPTRPSLSMSQNNSTEFCFTQKTTEGSDLLKSPASTASFIFSKSTKKVVIETPTSPEAQAGLKQSLAAELMQVSEQTKCMAANGTKKTVKMPPPVAKKPAHGTNYLYKSGTATTPKAETSLKEQVSSVPKTEQANGGRANVQPAGQQAHQIHTEEAESGTEIANSIEVS